MKKRKLNLNELEVKSFITSLEHEKLVTIKGGDTEQCDSQGDTWCQEESDPHGPCGGGGGTGGGAPNTQFPDCQPGGPTATGCPTVAYC